LSQQEAIMTRRGTGADPRAALAIDEGLFVPVNGLEQWVTIRGRDPGNPVLLILSGMGAAFSALAPLFAAWEGDFTLVQWDQPGVGATLAKSGAAATGPLTLARLARDGIAVAEWAQDRLGVRKVAVLGVSGGSILGLMMAAARPDLISVFVGSGQVVDWAAQAQTSYAMVLERAREAGDAEGVAALEGIGPPPYPDAATDAVKSRYANAMTAGERAALGAAMAAPPPADARYVARGLPAQDAFAVAMRVYEALRGEITNFDARQVATRFEVPVVFLQGAEDAHTTTPEAAAYLEAIEAPSKTLAVIEGGGHSVVFMTDAFLAALREHVRPLALR
jgi:pimeloyl-ACP methyl ester carboxylesterase